MREDMEKVGAVEGDAGGSGKVEETCALWRTPNREKPKEEEEEED